MPISLPKLKTEEILKIPYEQIIRADEKTLEMYVKQMTATANARIRNLQKAGIENFATQKDPFSLKMGKDAQQRRNRLLSQYAQLRNFLVSPTSKQKGVYKVANELLVRLGKEKELLTFHKLKESFQANIGLVDRLWRIVDKLRERDPAIYENMFRGGDSNRYQQQVYNLAQSHALESDEEIMRLFEESLNKVQQQENEEIRGLELSDLDDGTDI